MSECVCVCVSVCECVCVCVPVYEQEFALNLGTGIQVDDISWYEQKSRSVSKNSPRTPASFMLDLSMSNAMAPPWLQ